MNRTLFAAALASCAFAATATLAQTAPPPPAPAPPGAQTDGPMRGMRGGMMMRLDANHDGVVTREEAMAEADARFAALDTNKDGKVTLAEMSASRDAMMARRNARRGDMGGAGGAGRPVPPPHMGKGMDANRDGAATRDEYRAHAAARFDRMDTNHDGRIDANEMAAMREMARMHRGDGPPPPAPNGGKQ